MPSELFQLGGLVVISYALIELVKFIIVKYTKKSTSNGATEVLQRIQGNDLLHIGDAMIEQNKILAHHTTQHDQQIILLTKILTTLELTNKK